MIKTKYRNQINKVANSVNEIVQGMKTYHSAAELLKNKFERPDEGHKEGMRDHEVYLHLEAVKRAVARLKQPDTIPDRSVS